MGEITNLRFVVKLFGSSGDSWPVVCGFAGDPNEDRIGKWSVKPVGAGWPKPRVLRMGGWNTYVGVSRFKAVDGRVRRRKVQFASLDCVMIDDLGDGPGAKLPMSRLKIAPTALVETSPDNSSSLVQTGRTSGRY